MHRPAPDASLGRRRLGAILTPCPGPSPPRSSPTPSPAAGGSRSSRASIRRAPRCSSSTCSSPGRPRTARCIRRRRPGSYPASTPWPRPCARGGLVAWIQHSNAPPGDPLYWATFYDNFIRPERRAASLATLAPGAPLHALDPRLDTHAEDLRFRKYRFSAFTRNPEDPEALLRARGIDTVVVAGVATNICCESTARDAMMRDFRVFMPHDAVTAGDAEAHGAGLLAVAQVFADIRPVEALLRLMEAS